MALPARLIPSLESSKARDVEVLGTLFAIGGYLKLIVGRRLMSGRSLRD